MISVTQYDAVTLLTLDRAERRNALTLASCDELRVAVVDAVAGGARALVLTGAGSSFCSGADLDGVYSLEFRDALYAMLHVVAEAPVPVVAAVNGPAIGAGTQLAIAADLRVLAPSARFAVPTAKLGLAVDPWTIRRLAQLAGHGTARTMLLACSEIDVDAALARGLADRAGELADALDWAATMASLAPLTIAYSKRVLDETVTTDPTVDAAFDAVWASEYLAEGALARRERRPAVFSGS